MPINNYQNFTYEGYTLGGDLPTLYFAEGRYTQVHGTVSNIGWHPSHTAHCIRINISPAAVKIWQQIPVSDAKGESEFAKKVVAGDYTDNSDQGTLCECYTDDNLNYTTHVSRSRFVKVGDKDFNGAYDKAYALGVLAKGVLAPNEH